MLVTLEINNKDPTYDWFLAWMAHRQQNTAQSGATRWTRSHQLSVETAIERRKNGSASASFNLVAGPGTHYFNYRGAWMQVRALCLVLTMRSLQLVSLTTWRFPLR
jgi:mitochondrial chaperone BCS1